MLAQVGRVRLRQRRRGRSLLRFSRLQLRRTLDACDAQGVLRRLELGLARSRPDWGAAFKRAQRDASFLQSFAARAWFCLVVHDHSGADLLEHIRRGRLKNRRSAQ
jgi:hypothetical protein